MHLSLSYGIFGQGHLGASLGNISGGTIPNILKLLLLRKMRVEIGVDLRLFDNKLSIDATYYDNETLGDIVGVSASSTSGLRCVLLQTLVIFQTQVLNYLSKVR